MAVAFSGLTAITGITYLSYALGKKAYIKENMATPKPYLIWLNGFELTKSKFWR